MQTKNDIFFVFSSKVLQFNNLLKTSTYFFISFAYLIKHSVLCTLIIIEKPIYMKLNKLIIPVACILLAGNASMAQVIMPWENRTETDGDPFAKGETTATRQTPPRRNHRRTAHTDKRNRRHDVDEGWRAIQPDGTKR